MAVRNTRSCSTRHTRFAVLLRGWLGIPIGIWATKGKWVTAIARG